MVKLTVIYNLPPGANHDQFLKWRTTEHQKVNMSIPGIFGLEISDCRDHLPPDGLDRLDLVYVGHIDDVVLDTDLR